MNQSPWPPYPQYKDSRVEWLGEVPEHWEVKKLKYCLLLSTRKIEPQKSQVALENIESWTGRFIETETKFEGDGIAFEEGDILFGKLRPYLAKVFLAQFSGEAVGDFFVMRPFPTTDGRFIQYQILNKTFISIIDSSTFGAKMPRVDWEFMGNMELTLPSLSEQLAIASFLDSETSRIDALIAEQNRFIEIITEEMLSMVTHSFECHDTKWIRLQYVSEIISRPVNQQDNESYIRLGLYNKGRGVFKKDVADNEDMGDSDFFWIQEGDLIISGQFAWEGAVALATKDHSGCVVSHRFPVIRGCKDEVLTEYLLALFMTHYGDFILNECSRGSAGRNRPLNINMLLKWKIPVPPIAYQQKIAFLISMRERIREKLDHNINLLKEYRSSLITAAVTGKIDVRGFTPLGSERKTAHE